MADILILQPAINVEPHYVLSTCTYRRSITIDASAESARFPKVV
jgi:hypothetical protein